MANRAGPAPGEVTSCGPRALCGWSPPDTVADTPAKRLVDRFMPRSGIAVCVYFAAIVGLLLIAPAFPRPAELTVDGIAALAAGGWCGLNFWRCRHAHCLVTAVGWLGLAGFTFIEAAIGRSLIIGEEHLVFIAVLAAGLVFECAWCLTRGTHAVVATSPPRG